MRQAIVLGILACLSLVSYVRAEDPYVYLNWVVEYGEISPLDVKQRGILINGQFPGPTVNVVTNDNERSETKKDFMARWCARNELSDSSKLKLDIQDANEGSNWEFHLLPVHANAQSGRRVRRIQYLGQVRDSSSVPQAIRGIHSPRQRLVEENHKELQQILDSGNPFPPPDGILINGKPRLTSFDVVPGSRDTHYAWWSAKGHIRCRKCTSHTRHVGQSSSLVTLHSHNPRDYFIVASTRFTKPILTATAVLHYQGSNSPASGPLPIAPTYHVHWSMKQARTVRWNFDGKCSQA
ncbi:UNVERIFIED_CONTAM: L-ascorbate oxidase [Sesamum radiatum]|uniref:L-ascorbate oxidase n=1 Tax=Sesamum radiatum TaxID=300843 RepID=A0AAW2P3W8_SESRA